ncbi:hypothetical protein FMM68_00255 [Lachnospiraceae bacterium MD329]|nr:hypothetical protein [Lachnospiraceae bacterium MD329]
MFKLVWGIIALIIISGIATCIFLLKYHKTKGNPIIEKVTIPIIIALTCAFLVCCAGLKLGDPVTFISGLLNINTPSPMPSQAPSTLTPTPVIYTEPTFEKRTSEKFNYTIDCPSNFVLEGGLDQDEEDDFNLTSADREATLNFTARYIDGELPDKFTIDTFRRTYGGTELYREDLLERDGWYVISTKTFDGYYHYRKCIFTNGIVRMYTFSFPTDQEDIYLTNYDYVSHIENSFIKLN